MVDKTRLSGLVAMFDVNADGTLEEDDLTYLLTIMWCATSQTDERMAMFKEKPLAELTSMAGSTIKGGMWPNVPGDAWVDRDKRRVTVSAFCEAVLERADDDFGKSILSAMDGMEAQLAADGGADAIAAKMAVLGLKTPDLQELKIRVSSLVAKFDVNGDGVLQDEELIYFLVLFQKKGDNSSSTLEDLATTMTGVVRSGGVSSQMKCSRNPTVSEFSERLMLNDYVAKKLGTIHDVIEAELAGGADAITAKMAALGLKALDMSPLQLKIQGMLRDLSVKGNEISAKFIDAGHVPTSDEVQELLTGEVLPHLSEIFLLSDSNGNGTLDLEECTRLFRQYLEINIYLLPELLGGNASDSILKASVAEMTKMESNYEKVGKLLLKRLDIKGTGTVNKDDFVSGFLKTINGGLLGWSEEGGDE